MFTGQFSRSISTQRCGLMSQQNCIASRKPDQVGRDTNAKHKALCACFRMQRRYNLARAYLTYVLVGRFHIHINIKMYMDIRHIHKCLYIYAHAYICDIHTHTNMHTYGLLAGRSPAPDPPAAVRQGGKRCADRRGAMRRAGRF